MNIRKTTKNLLLLAATAAVSCTASAYDFHVIVATISYVEIIPSTVALISAERLGRTGSIYQSMHCGGTIVGDRWVLTAAHCVENRDGELYQPEDLLVLMGTTDLANPATDPVAIERIIQHENWNLRTIKNDIALLELAQRASQPAIRLDTQPAQLQDDAYIAGWGAESINADGAPTSYPTHLQGVYVDVTPGDICQQMYPVYAGFIDDSQICVGVPEGGKSSCFGDSGGPAYRVTDEQTLILAGVTSFGAFCAGAESPGVYVSVFAYRDWILSHIGAESQQVEPEQEQENDGQNIGGGGSGDVSPAGAGASFFFLPLLLALAIRQSRKLLALLMVLGVATGTAPLQANDDSVGIVGGDELDIVFVPSIVALIDGNRQSNSGSYKAAQFCGGTLISDRWVLTAAHCVDYQGQVIAAEDLLILMGQSEIDDAAEPVTVDRIIVHPEWDDREIVNDMALLELSFSASAPARALDFQPVTSGDQGYIAGWGTEEVDDQNNPTHYGFVLKGAYVPLTRGDECETTFPSVPFPVYADTICAGGTVEDLGGCFGDSGGPAYRVTEEYGLVLAGVASYVTGLCGQLGRPTVYTSVVDFKDWIVSHVGQDNLAVLPTQDATSGGGAGDNVSPAGAGASLFFLPLLLTLVARQSRRLLALSMAAVVALSAAPTHANDDLSADDLVGIIGGDDLDIAFVPSIVALIDRNRQSSTGSFERAQFCGGTLISDRWVLTAAHCVDLNGQEMVAEDVLILMGESEIDATSEPVTVDRFVVHPGWDEFQAINDIALIELSFSASAPARVLDFQPVTSGDQGYIAGYGTEIVDENNNVVEYGTSLRGAYVPLTAGNECNEEFPEIRESLSEDVFCTGGRTDDLGACFGDSGGPAYRVTDDNILVLAGVASFVTGVCGKLGSPAVYSSAFEFRDWIVGEVGAGNLAVLPTENSGGSAGGGGGGGAAWLMLPLLFVAALLRKRQLRVVLVASIFTSVLSACLSATTLNAGDNEAVEDGDMSVSIFEQPLGEAKEDVYDSIAAQWKSTPDCSVDRTGVGKLMRAYFLETCEFANTAEETICGFKPATAQYYFLEDKLVRVSFAFDEGTDTAGYRECVLSKGWELGFNQVAIEGSTTEQADGVLRLTGSEPTVGVVIGEDDLTHVSDVEVVATIHSLKGSL